MQFTHKYNQFHGTMKYLQNFRAGYGWPYFWLNDNDKYGYDNIARYNTNMVENFIKMRWTIELKQYQNLSN